MANSLDATALVNIAKNRSRLLRLADGIRTRKKPGGSKKCLRLDPAYTNIEHLVFGTYRTRPTTPDSSSSPPATGEALVRRAQLRSSDGSESSRASSEPSNGCECSRHSPHLRPASAGGDDAPAPREGDGSDSRHRGNETSGHVERRRQSDGDQRATMTEQPGRIRKTLSTDDPQTPKCTSWRDVAAAAARHRDVDSIGAPRSNSVRVYCSSSNTDKSAFERQNTFPSGIPKPIGGAAKERQRTRQQQNANKEASPTKQPSRKVNHSVDLRERSPGHQLKYNAFRKTDDSDDSLANGKAGAVTCKIRITPPNGPAKNGKVAAKSSPRNSASAPKSVQNGPRGKPAEDRQQKPEDVAGNRVRSRSKGHQHGMQSAVQKGERQSGGRTATGIPVPEPKDNKQLRLSPKKTEEPQKVAPAQVSNGTEIMKTTWAQLRSKSVETPVTSNSQRRGQTLPRQYHSLDEPEENGASQNSAEPFRVEFDLGGPRVLTGSKIRLDVGAPAQPTSLPCSSVREEAVERTSPRPEDKPLHLDGPVSLPLPCEDEDSAIMCETSLPHDAEEVLLRNRNLRPLGSPSRHFDLRLLAAFQRYGEDAVAKEALEAENWMSDIEERDENSSSGASRAASEEPPDPERKSPRRLKVKGASLGLERLLETPRNVSVISIESHSDGSPQIPSSPGQAQTTKQEEVCQDVPADVASESSAGHGGLPSPFTVREQTSVTRRGAMHLSTPPAKSPPWEKTVTIETGSLTNCHLLVQDSLEPSSGQLVSEASSPPRSLERRPAKPTSPAPLPPSTPIHASCRLLRNRPISRSERHLKTTSTPEIRAPESGSVKDVRRPWSEVYCEVEARNLLAQSNCQSVPNFPHFEGSSPPTAGTDAAGHSFFQRLSSVRATDSMLQKFRKSFTLRFQKSGRFGKPDSSWTPAPQETPAVPPVVVEDNQGDVVDRSFVTDGSSWNVADNTDCSSLASGQQLVKEEVGVFRLGLGAIRSSRDRKKCKSKQKKEARGSKCNSADSGIQVEATCASSDGTNEANSAEESPAVIRRRTISQGHDHGLADDTLASILDHEPGERNLGDVYQELDTFNADEKLFSPVRRTPSVERQMSTPPPIKVRSERIRPKIRRQKGRGTLRRSISQPLDLEKMGVHHKNIEHGLSDQEASREASTASSEEDFSSDEGGFRLSSTALPKQSVFREMYEDTVTFAEALWDHVTIDPEELPFKAGEVIEVTDSSDKDWWWGAIGHKSGWFPAAFVRLRVSQEATVEDCILRMTEGMLGVRHCQHQSRKMSVSLLSNEQVRANIVKEIVTTEKDFVRHLKDVVEGYLSQVRRRPDMFTEEHISTIFGNIEEIYQFQSTFLKHLESSINWQLPHTSEIGHCFLLHKDRFRIYSEYCNNHPLAVSQLQELYADPKYIHFFEACRLLQEMIDISLDGFLLTPVQKICKYPLQLAELLKYTRHDHADYQLVLDALGAMRGVAQLVNERKRRMECLERLIEWQKTIEGWEGGDLIDSSSMLIYSGEVTRVTSSWSRDLALFLFDHTIVYCKKDLLKRNIHVYRGRINLDHCCVFDVEDGKDAQFGITVRNAWKIHCNSRDKWFLFYAKSPMEKSRWLQAFREERQQVVEDRDQGFRITDQDKKAAKLAVLNKSKVKRPRAKIPKGPRPHPDTAVVEILLDPSGPKTRSGSLPSNLNPAVVVNGNARAIPAKKKGSGWFHFGSGKKSKK